MEVFKKAIKNDYKGLCKRCGSAIKLSEQEYDSYRSIGTPIPDCPVCNHLLFLKDVQRTIYYGDGSILIE